MVLFSMHLKDYYNGFIFVEFSTNYEFKKLK